MTDYKSMFEQAVRTLAAIDEALGIGDDGCGDPEQTLDSIACLKASPISEEAMDILRAENDKLKAEARKVGSGGTAVTRDMITAAHGVTLETGDVVLSAKLLERIYKAMAARQPLPRNQPCTTCKTCEALARTVMMDQTGAA